MPSLTGRPPDDLEALIQRTELAIQKQTIPLRMLEDDVSLLMLGIMRLGRWVHDTRYYYETGNPLLLFSSIANWPAGVPVHSDVWERLQEISSSIAVAAETIIHRERDADGPTPEDGNAAVLHALGIVREGGSKGGNAFADLRRRGITNSARALLGELRHQYPNKPEKHLVGLVADRLGLSEQHVRRLVRAARQRHAQKQSQKCAV
jgi:hypothetical protein